RLASPWARSPGRDSPTRARSRRKMPAKSANLVSKRSAHAPYAAVSRIQRSAPRPAVRGGAFRLIVDSHALFPIPLGIHRRRFQARCFFNPRLLCAISLGEFSLCLQPVLKVIAEQSALSATDLISAIQNLFDLQGLVNFVLAK